MTNTTIASPKSPPAETWQTGFVVLNPVAGKGQPEALKQVLETTLGSERYTLYETSGDEDLAEVVRTAVSQNSYSWVAAIGGDGTVSLVVDGLVGSELPLLIIPAGTGNVLAQELNIPQDPADACRLLKPDQGTIREIDLIQIENRYFMHQLGIGLESQTMASTSSEQKNRWGLAAYLVTAVKEAFGWQPYKLTLTVDDKTHHLRAAELAIANVGKIGAFGLSWDKTISPDDGRIDIVVLRARSLADYARAFWALITGQQHRSTHFNIFSAWHSLKLATERPLQVHGDGETLDDLLPFTAAVRPGMLPVIVPA